jgi:hypothetical protein
MIYSKIMPFHNDCQWTPGDKRRIIGHCKRVIHIRASTKASVELSLAMEMSTQCKLRNQSYGMRTVELPSSRITIKLQYVHSTPLPMSSHLITGYPVLKIQLQKIIPAYEPTDTDEKKTE